MPWLLFFVLVVALLALDLGVFRRRDEAVGMRGAVGWSVFWVSLGLAFTVPVYLMYEHAWFDMQVPPAPGAQAHRSPPGWLGSPGADAAVQYLTAYLLEKSLSVDNLFVIAVVFDAFRVPKAYRHRVLVWGIGGALVMRGIMIGSGLWALSHFSWLFPIFGAYLAYTGWKLFRSNEEDAHPESSRVVNWLRRHLPIAPGDHGPHFFVRIGGKLQLTTLALVLLAVEWTDVVFALDSVPAVVGVTNEPFLAFSSNVFAILGLRALFFVLEALLDKFSRLKYALAAILIFIGAKMLLHHVYVIPNLVSLAIVIGLLIVGMLASGTEPTEPDR